MFSSWFLKYSPINKFVIREKSMEPYLKEGDEVIALKYFFPKPKVGDVIIFSHPTPPHIFIKRISKIKDKEFWVIGDNKEKSIDSRNFGFIKRENIIGKIIKKL